MKEFMFYIRNKKDAKKPLTEVQHLTFIKQFEIYIGKLKSENKLFAAQQLFGKVWCLKRQKKVGQKKTSRLT